MNWLVIILVVLGVVTFIGLGRALFKGHPMTFRDFLFTVFFLDVMFDDWSGDDSGLGDADTDF